jgi:hypothetical protein
VAKKKRKRTEPDDIESIQYARSLLTKAWAEMGIDDPAAHVRLVVDRLRAEIAERQAKSA